MKGDRYMPPLAPGYSVEIKPESLDQYEFPNGEIWKNLNGAG
jgi:L-fuconate dehydratase